MLLGATVLELRSRRSSCRARSAMAHRGSMLSSGRAAFASRSARLPGSCRRRGSVHRGDGGACRSPLTADILMPSRPIFLSRSSMSPCPIPVKLVLLHLRWRDDLRAPGTGHNLAEAGLDRREEIAGQPGLAQAPVAWREYRNFARTVPDRLVLRGADCRQAGFIQPTAPLESDKDPRPSAIDR